MNEMHVAVLRMDANNGAWSAKHKIKLNEPPNNQWKALDESDAYSND
jgi:hypothetical protein